MPATPVPPMLPSNALVMAANEALASPDFRDQVRKLHDENASLVKMVEVLGLEAEMTDRIRQILEELPTDVVDGIRKATLEMLDSKDYVMPLDCTVTDAELDAGVPVDVEVLPESGIETIHVRPTASA